MSETEIIEVKSFVEEMIIDLKNSIQPKPTLELLTVEDLKTLFKRSETTIWRWAKNGTIIPYSIGGGIYFKREDIDSALVRVDLKKKEVIPLVL